MSLQTTNYLALYGSKGCYTLTSFDSRYTTIEKIIANIQKDYNPEYIAVKETFISISDLAFIDLDEYIKGMIFDD